MATDTLDIVWKGAAASNFHAGRSDAKPDVIVIHVMAGTARGTDVWFNNPAAHVSAHYGIAKTGSIHQYVDEKDTAYHAGIAAADFPRASAQVVKDRPGVNPNQYSIGIEHEGQSGDAWPDAMLDASRALVKKCAATWGIPLDRYHIVGHYEIYPGHHCPGPALDMDAYVAALNAPDSTEVAGPDAAAGS
jgi:N-acetyl-anhydromuramyl-L-alanine amidase AmpD